MQLIFINTIYEIINNLIRLVVRMFIIRVINFFQKLAYLIFGILRG